MKKYFLAALMIIHLSLVAQQKSSSRFSFSIGAGAYSSSYTKEAGDKQISTNTEKQHHTCIIFNTGLLLKLSDKWKLGPSFTYDHFGTKYRSAEFSNISYTLRIERSWMHTNQLSLHSGINAGIKKMRKFSDEKEIKRQISPAFHINVMSAEYQLIGKWYINLEAGWGVAGVINCSSRIYF